MINSTTTLSVAAVLTATTNALAIAQAPLPEPKAQQMTDAYYSAFGDNHSRAVHAKGIMFEGTFTPDLAARSVTKAKLFALSTAAMLGRFSNFTGIPTIPDNVGDATPRGLALKFTFRATARSIL
jgi:catalase